MIYPDMRAFVRAGAVALGVAAAALTATVATAQIKEAKDVKIIFVTHGQANDVYWSVVKNGVEAGQKVMGSQVEYHAPETFDMVQIGIFYTGIDTDWFKVSSARWCSSPCSSTTTSGTR